MMTAPIATFHDVTFVRDKNDVVAHCTCGWMMRGTRAEVYNRAAVHDIDQWPVTDDDMHRSLR